MRSMYFSAIFALAFAPVANAQEVDYSTVGLTSAAPVLGGFTTCKADLELAFAVSGLVVETNVVEGQVVKKGDVLMALDQTIEKIDIQRRQAVLHDTSELRAATARRELALEQMMAAKAIYDASGGISLEEVQNRTLAHELATIEIARLEAQATVNELDYLTSVENLRRRTLYAPNDGIISNIETKTGEGVQVNDPVINLCDLSAIEFTSNIPVSIADALHVNDLVWVNISVKNLTLEASIKFVSPVVDEASGLQKVKAVITERKEWLRPGMSATLALARN
jgi:RND family efflux transporter MFP subunit